MHHCPLFQTRGDGRWDAASYGLTRPVASGDGGSLQVCSLLWTPKLRAGLHWLLLHVVCQVGVMRCSGPRPLRVLHSCTFPCLGSQCTAVLQFLSVALCTMHVASASLWPVMWCSTTVLRSTVRCSAGCFMVLLSRQCAVHSAQSVAALVQLFVAVSHNAALCEVPVGTVKHICMQHSPA